LTALRLRLFVAFALVAAAICVRLGFWQISRLHQRQARNALVRMRADSAEADFWALPSDTAAARFRRVRIVGAPDYEHELIFAARTHRGSPGVNFLTPVRVAGHDTAVLVNRGWIYSPDGATVDAAKWRERDSTFVGYVETFPGPGGATYATRPNTVSHLGYGVAAKAVPYPLAKTYIVMLGDSVMAADRIARLTLPPLDEGPHLSYAIQWFGFALVAVVGAGFVVKKSAQDPEADRAGDRG
jgi:surfeit locus 1 family protein